MANTAIATAAPLPPSEGDWIYVRYFRHWRSGKIVYPKKGKFFRFRRRRS